jgi:molecular chaperone HscA
VIGAAGLKPADLAGLFLVGGSSRVPLVARLLHGDLGIAPTVLEQPELPVAEGAIITTTPLAPGSPASGLPATGTPPSGSPASGAPGASAPASGAPANATEQGPAAHAPEDAQTPAAPMRPAAVQPLVDTMTHNGPQEVATEVDHPLQQAAAADGSPADPAAPPHAARSAAGTPTPAAAASTRPAPDPAPDPASARSAPAPTPDPAPAVASTRPAAAATVAEQRPTSDSGTPEPHYAEPVDPWATGEAAAFGNAGGGPIVHPTSGAPVSAPRADSTPRAEPWLASTHPDPAGGEAAPGEADAVHAPGAKLPAYRRKGLWVVAAATVVVLGVAAALAVVFWPGYPALDYRPLTDLQRFPPAAPVTSAFNQTSLRDGRAYFASADENGLLGIVATTTGDGKVAWRNTEAGSATRWEYFFALPDAVVAITDTDSTSSMRRMVLLDAGSGAKLWERAVGANDNLLFADDIIVLVDRTEHRLIGLEVGGKGKARWEQKTPTTEYGLSSTNVVAATTEDDFAGAAAVGGVPFAEPLDDDQRIVQISADESARVIDAGTGEIVGSPRAGVADPNDSVIAHNGRLVVIESGSNTKRVVAYDLEKLGAQPKVLYTAPDTGTAFEGLTACGKDRVCLVETAASDAKTAKVVAIDAAEGGDLWKLAVPDVDGIVPVGEALLATLNTSPGQVTLVGADGKKAWTRAGVVGRLDAGNVLQFSKALSASADDPALSGEHLGDDPEPLGSLADIRSSSCSWDDKYLACVADADFVLQRFTG